MKKLNGIYIDLKNKEQVEWWNNTASKMVKVKHYDTIVETATNKPVGVLLALGGIRKNKVIKENHKFIKNPVRHVFNKEKAQ
mgnify:CR=1 FL=1